MVTEKSEWVSDGDGVVMLPLLSLLFPALSVPSLSALSAKPVQRVSE